VSTAWAIAASGASEISMAEATMMPRNGILFSGGVATTTF